MVAKVSGRVLNRDRASSSVGGAFRAFASGARTRRPRKTRVLLRFHPSGRSSKIKRYASLAPEQVLPTPRTSSCRVDSLTKSSKRS